MGIINWVAIGGILIDLVIISMIVSSTYWGYRKGLVGVIFKVLVFIVSLLIVFVLYKPVSNSIIKNTEIDDKIAEVIRSNLEGTTLSDGQLLEASESNFSAGVVNLINLFVSEALNQAKSDAVGYVATELSYFIIRVGTMLLLFMLSKFFLLFIRFAAELIASLPVIKMFNKSGGLIYGIIKGFLLVYVILAILSVISPLVSSWGIMNAVGDSFIGSRMYNNNIILNLIIK